MRKRCMNQRCKNFKYYGGRGILVCERWNSFASFLADMGWAPEGLELDRVNNNGHYEPSNCKWSTRTEQARNKRGLTLSVELVAEIKGRLSYGQSQTVVARALNVSDASVYGIKIGKTWRDVAPAPKALWRA